jgi:hypothetical protein
MLNNVPTYYNNVLYPSKAEAKYAEFLDTQVEQGRVKWWRRQVSFKVYDHKTRTIITDFLVMAEREEIHEVKRGYYSESFVYKSQLWLKFYPNFPYFICEPEGSGNCGFSKTPLREFIKPYLVTQPNDQKGYTKLEIWLSKMFYKLASKLVK